MIPVTSDARLLIARLVAVAALAVCDPGRASAHPDGPGGDDAAAPVSYSLFHPAPRGAMRTLGTDRPDRTESPYTLDAGHLQLEMDALVYGRDRTPGVTSEQWGLAITNVKLGVLHNADFQVIVETWLRDRTEVASPSGPEVWGSTRFGDAIARLKVNVWGNDAGRTALGIMPFASLRSVSTTDFGLIVPFAATLPHGLGLGAMAEIDWRASDHRARWVGSSSVSRAIAGDLAGFVELWGAQSFDRGQGNPATLDAGITYALGEDLRLDTGVFLGLGRPAQDLTVFLGVALRR